MLVDGTLHRAQEVARTVGVAWAAAGDGEFGEVELRAGRIRERSLGADVEGFTCCVFGVVDAVPSDRSSATLVDLW